MPRRTIARFGERRAMNTPCIYRCKRVFKLWYLCKFYRMPRRTIARFGERRAMNTTCIYRCNLTNGERAGRLADKLMLCVIIFIDRRALFVWLYARCLVTDDAKKLGHARAQSYEAFVTKPHWWSRPIDTEQINSPDWLLMSRNVKAPFIKGNHVQRIARARTIYRSTNTTKVEITKW